MAADCRRRRPLIHSHSTCIHCASCTHLHTLLHTLHLTVLRLHCLSMPFDLTVLHLITSTSLRSTFTLHLPHCVHLISHLLTTLHLTFASASAYLHSRLLIYIVSLFQSFACLRIGTCSFYISFYCLGFLLSGLVRSELSQSSGNRDFCTQRDFLPTHITK